MADKKRASDIGGKKKLLYIAGIILLTIVMLLFGDKLPLLSDLPGSGDSSVPDTTATISVDTSRDTSEDTGSSGLTVEKDGRYTSKEEVALYIHTFGCLPSNFITKSRAREMGWPDGGPVEPYAPGCCIGGDKFGNNEDLLPKKSGRQYYECDIDAPLNSSRNSKRIVYSNDGLIYYTEDHYQSYELLYGTP